MKLFAGLALWSFTVTALAHPPFVDQFNATYPDSMTGEASSCAVCHRDVTGDDPWNAYGRDLLAGGARNIGIGGNIVPFLLGVELVNSDIIAGNNLAEIIASSQPGWCEPTTIGCNNQAYEEDGTNAGPATPPVGILLDDDVVVMDPDINVVPSSLDFGEVVVGQAREQSVAISNSGGTDLIVNLSLTGSPTFSFVSASPLTIPTSTSINIPVFYAPDILAIDNGLLLADTNDPDTPQVVVSLSGTGVSDVSMVCSAGNELADPLPGPIVRGDIAVRLRTIVTGLTAPNLGVAPDNDETHLYVVDQPGIVWEVNLLTGRKRVFMDVQDLVVTMGAFGHGSFDERGLLGLAFHPDFGEVDDLGRLNRFIYTYTSEPNADFSTMPIEGPANHQSVITRWTVNRALTRVNPRSAKVLLRIDQPQFNHNGGMLAFGPDDNLFISLGDGGAGNDLAVGHSMEGNGQDPSNVLGSILRINVDPKDRNSLNRKYGIPEDNPFFPGTDDDDGPFGGEAGCLDGFCDEIYAFGLRNPWRFSFDTETDELYAADVGQGDLEEVNIITAGGNYGWRIKEGTFCFDTNGFVTDGIYTGPLDLIDPIAQYDHDEGISVTGGFVYRGEDIPELEGKYVFADWAKSFVGEGGRLFYLEGNEIREFQLVGQTEVGFKINGFGQDDDGELYIMGYTTGTPFGTTGVVLKIVPAFPDDDTNDLDGDDDSGPGDD